MELRQLRVFHAVARAGSVTTAASQLHLTASALSHALRALEEELGVRLFDRVGKRLRLSVAGEVFLAGIEPHVQGLNAAAEALRRLIQGGRARLRLGAPASVCSYLLPRVIRDLLRTFPRAEICLESADTPGLLEHVRAGAADLGLGLAPAPPSDLKTHPVFRDELLLTLSPDHRWARRVTLPWDEVAEEVLILDRRTGVTAQMVLGYLRARGVAAPRIMEVGSVEAIKELVRLNLGVAVLPPWMADRELRRRQLLMRPLGPRPLRREWTIFHRADRPLLPLESHLLRLCRAHAAGMRLDRRDCAPVRPAAQ